jgi:tetratricopeptide (TPR) repeat protein
MKNKKRFATMRDLGRFENSVSKKGSVMAKKLRQADIIPLAPGMDGVLSEDGEVMHLFQNDSASLDMESVLQALMSMSEEDLETSTSAVVEDVMSQLESAAIAKKIGAPSEKAMEFFEKALDAEDILQHMVFIGKALEVDPWYTDAWLYQLECVPLENEDSIEALRHLKTIAERRLGKKAFKECAGHFWGFMETRPYMRVCAALAEALIYEGYFDEAIAELERVLELNPGDNQGVRYWLLPTYLRVGKLEEAAHLEAKYPGECEWSVSFAWSRILRCWLQQDVAGAEDALQAARKQNPHMEPYLVGKKELPDMLPDSYTLGSKEEALAFAEYLVPAWQHHPEAVEWLLAHSKTKPRSGKTGAAKKKK